MNLGEKDIKRISTLLLIGILAVLAFFVVRPILIATLTGLILAYIFTPVYRRVSLFIKNRTLAAWTVSIVIVIIIFLPLWFILPIVMQQAYNLFSYYQTLDVNMVVKSLFPTASEQLVTQMELTLKNMIGTITLAFSKTIMDFILNVPYLLIDLFIIAFVFFYALRDSDKLIVFFKAISPLSEPNEKLLIRQFKDMTDAVIYGQIIVGIVQGLFAGIGFALFGIQNSMILTLLAILFSLIPFIGPWIIWGPVNIYLFASGNISLAIAYLLYNLLIVSVVDNIIRSYLIARKTKISPAIVIVGMIGGVFVFNLLGLIIGPLILAYLVSLLESFKNHSVYNLFSNKS